MSKKWIILGTIVSVNVLFFVLFTSFFNASNTLAASEATSSGAPGLIAYQGYLTNDANEPFTGVADMQFGLYTAVSGGSSLWQETHNDVAVTAGYFTIYLGSVNSLNADNFSDTTRYLQITVDQGDGFVELPRQQFMAVPYALQAQEAASVAWSGITDVPASVGNSWSLNGNSGTDPAIHKLGTTDAVSLTLVMSDMAVLRFVPAYSGLGDFAPNVTTNPFSNTIQADVSGSVIGGGTRNEIAGIYGTIGGGFINDTVGNYATIGGGYLNSADGPIATVGGGYLNNAAGEKSTAGGGYLNNAAGDYATVGGGDTNTATGSHATVGGGNNNNAAGSTSTIAGGDDNIAAGSYTTIGGGNDNVADGFSIVISGGSHNSATTNYAAVGGGYANNATEYAATVSGGYENAATGVYAAVGGGFGNIADGAYSYAAGNRAQANHNGTFVWSDSSNFIFSSTGVDQFLVEADGGMGVGTNDPATQLHVVAARNGAANMTEHVVAIENNATEYGSGPDVLALKVTNQSDPGPSANYITFTDADGGIGAVEGNSSGGVTFKTTGADFAEYLPLANPSATIEAGTIVALSHGQISQNTTDVEQLFVVSTAAGFIGNAQGDVQPQGTALVALLGQVPVQVRGQVHTGDYILPSGLHDGYGIAVSLENLTPAQVGQVVGLALEPSDGTGQVLIMVGIPRDTIWQTLLQAQATQLSELEARLAQLETLILEASE